MKASSIASVSLAALAAAAAPPLFAQATYPPQDSYRMPYQKDFWTTGHAGISLGRSKLDESCPAGFSCDNKANAWKAYVGGRFNNTFGGEITYLKTSDFTRGGGGTNMRALNFGLLAGIPFGLGMNSSIFGKLGVLWGHTEVTGAALMPTGDVNGWGPSVGLGAMIGVTRDWAVRLDWDRYRFKMPGGSGRDNVDSLMIGAQYTFGNPR